MSSGNTGSEVATAAGSQYLKTISCFKRGNIYETRWAAEDSGYPFTCLLCSKRCLFEIVLCVLLHRRHVLLKPPATVCAVSFGGKVVLNALRSEHLPPFESNVYLKVFDLTS